MFLNSLKKIDLIWHGWTFQFKFNVQCHIPGQPTRTVLHQNASQQETEFIDYTYRPLIYQCYVQKGRFRLVDINEQNKGVLICTNHPMAPL